MPQRGEVFFAVVANKAGQALAQNILAEPVQGGKVARPRRVTRLVGKGCVHVRGGGRIVADNAVDRGQRRAILGKVGQRRIQRHLVKPRQPAIEIQKIQGV